MTADEFYCLRDNRTQIAAPNVKLATAKVVLSIDEAAANTRGGQLTYLTVANLLSRWCRTVFLRPNQIERIISVGTGLSQELIVSTSELMRRADPFGRFEVTDEAADIHLHVGVCPPAGGFPIIGDGWVARTGSMVNPPTDSDNAIGSVLAACFGCAHAMRTALGLETSTGISFSPFNFQVGGRAANGPVLSEVQLGKVLLVGCGAVGAGIAYLLPYLPLRTAELLLVDGDVVDFTNLNRVPIFFFDDAIRPKEKTLVVSEFLKLHGIHSRILPGRFDDAVRAGLETRLCDLVIPAANEDGVHAAIQAQYPPLMIYGTTGTNWDAHLHRHIPLIEDCLACRFPSDRPMPEFTCAQGNLGAPVPEEPEERSIGVLPFLSLAAATLAAAEMLRLVSSDSLTAGNFGVLRFDTAELHPIRVSKRGRKCIHCWDGALWQSLGTSQRFARLSQGAQN